GTIFFILIDNLRYDQWKVLQPVLSQYFKVEKEEVFCAILPTATQYARNALFAGLLPSEIEKRFPNMWKNDDDEGGKNMHEEEFLAANLKRMGKDVKFSYNKITNHAAGKKLNENFSNLMSNKLNVIVYNFVDMLSHARTEMEVIRELADDEAAYRSLTLSWFEHSPLQDIIKQIADKKCRVIITTDHGTIKVTEPTKVVGDRNVNTNLRYKQGKSLDYVKKDVFEIRNPADVYLPKNNVSTAYIFAKQDYFFAYPNNYNHYVTYYRNTFQHGGISLEEMIIPFVVLSPK
ncbi:MAG TPA: PglZ domain-containing protein, partial [Bacteroidia bacterium]|nr:PglZ domain-containing protein [Bacteroidia bacterium]